MRLPVMPFVAPMLAKPVTRMPSTGHAFEPKWDGFRCVLFRDGDEVVVASRDGKDLAYCFPEVVEFARLLLPPRVVVDGELVIVAGDRLDFESLGSRIRPRSEAGRPSIAALAASTPAQFVAFDLLALGDRSLLDAPYSERRAALEVALAGCAAPLHLTPMTTDLGVAERWFDEFEGAGLDGLVCKALDSPYSPGARTMLKLKHARTADVVVAGWREHKSAAPDGSPLLGSLLLGAYDHEGRLQHLGVSSAFTASRRAELAAELMALEVGEGEPHPWLEPVPGTRAPGGASRWTGGRDLSFRAVRPTFVAEVGYDHLQGDRFRHTTSFVRWRPDRDPRSCTLDQFERPLRYDLADVLRGG